MMDDLSFGARLKNFYHTQLSTTDEKIHPELISALKITSIPKIDFYIQTVQLENHSPDMRFAATYTPIKYLQLRAGTGFNSETNFSTGFCLNWHRMKFDYALQNHPFLAQTHYFTLSMEVR